MDVYLFTSYIVDTYLSNSDLILTVCIKLFYAGGKAFMPPQGFLS